MFGGGEDVEPLLLRKKQNLWGNIKQVIKYFFETVWINYQYFKVNVRKRNLKNYLHLYLVVTSETLLLLDVILSCTFKLNYFYSNIGKNV